LLDIEEDVDRVLDRQGLGIGAWLLAGVQGVFLFQVLCQGTVRVVPRAEVVEFAPDLLGPDAGGVREEGEIGIGFGGFAGRRGCGRMLLGQGDCSLTRCHCDHGRGAENTPATF
jgi:hypothetical protein